jgi:hypothetical protein
MTHHESQHQHHHDQHHHAHKRKGIHRDWRAWLVVGLMLLAMIIYVLTMDESWQPFGNKPGQAMPAAPGPPAPVEAAP